MNADTLIVNIAQCVSAEGDGACRGRAMRDLHVLPDAAIAIRDGVILWVGRRQDWDGSAARTIDAQWKSVVPGLVDPHTHVVWGGDRLADFEARSSGATYEQILAAGGGIRHTTACTNAATEAELLASAAARVRAMVRAGTTTVEIKSGYGDTWEGEQRMLRVIGELSAHVPARIIPTMLLHVPPADRSQRAARVDDVITRWLPALKSAQLAHAFDIFLEQELAFTIEEAHRIFAAANAIDLPVKAHTDQLTLCGGLTCALAHNALSVDHLELSGEAEWRQLAQSSTVGVVLPGVTLHLGGAAANGRAMIDAGAAVAVGSDCNPGSSPLFSQAAAMALAVRLNGLTPAEALIAATANAAAALRLRTVGRISAGCAADCLILAASDWRELPYVLGGSVVDRVICAGEEVAA